MPVPGGFESDDSDDFYLGISSTPSSNGFNNNGQSQPKASINGNSNVNRPKAKRFSPKKSISQSTSSQNEGYNETEFIQIICNGSVDSLKSWFEKYQLPYDFVLKSGWTCLMLASSKCRPQILEYLIKEKANVNCQSNYMTPLLLVTSKESTISEIEEDIVKCAKILIQNGANVNAVDKYDTSPFLFAAQKNHISLLSLLATNGALVNSIDNRKWNALHHACFQGNHDAAVQLVELGVNARSINLAGCSPIDVAYAQGYTDLATFLDTGGKDALCNDANKQQQTILSSEQSLSSTDLELFLSGLDLSNLLSLLQDEHQLSLKQVVTLTDSELEKLGIKQMGVRKKLLAAFHDMHKRDWSITSFPHPTEFTRFLSCRDTSLILKNLLSHTQYINSSIVYVTKQLKTDSSFFMSSSKGDTTLKSVISDLNKSMDQLRELYSQMSALNNQIAILGELPGALTVVDAMPFITDRRLQRNKSITGHSNVFYFTSMTGLSVLAAVGVFCYYRIVKRT